METVCEPTVVGLAQGSDWEAAVSRAVAEGTRFFIAAGGDGTVNALVNTLDAVRGDVGLDAFVLGAVGLGSSNDFHKPVRREVAGIPVRLDATAATPRDLVECRWESGRALVVVSASIGVTAAANAFFNSQGRLLGALKRRSTDAAIAWSALRTIASFRGFPGRVELSGEVSEVWINNLSVLQTEWLSGTFRYDTPVDPADGFLQVNLLHGRSRLGTLRMLVAMSRGRFRGLSGTRCERVRSVDVELTEPAALELDGEIRHARSIHFEVLPQRIRTCP